MNMKPFQKDKPEWKIKPTAAEMAKMVRCLNNEGLSCVWKFMNWWKQYGFFLLY